MCSEDSPRIRSQFERLKAEAAKYLDCYFVINAGREPNPQSDIVSRPASAVFPVRSKHAEGGRLLPGHVDLVFVPQAMALPNPHVWIIEYDVDYAGDWANFFRQFKRNPADILTTTLQPWAESRDWYHWRWARIPAYVAETDRYRSFNPVLRMSQRFMRAYVGELLLNPWRGHSELMLTTIARHLGFVVEDVINPSRFQREDGRARNYHNTPASDDLAPGTFVWKPTRSAYFHEKPGTFEYLNMLYHPVKPDTRIWYAESAPEAVSEAAPARPEPIALVVDAIADGDDDAVVLSETGGSDAIAVMDRGADDGVSEDVRAGE
jgi:hypothetical protein